MQSANIPLGNHNPNGYTEEEVLRELRAIEGSRKVSFRYEHLDPDMGHIKWLDNILGGSVQMQYISQIKRTAKFTMRGGVEIDFLNDHIRPWYRLHMPPRWTEAREITSRAWNNSFTGASAGEDVTPGVSEVYGDRISVVSAPEPSGVQFNRVRRIASSSSIRLGHADGDSFFQSKPVNTETQDLMWRGYLYLEAGSHFRLRWLDSGGDLIDTPSELPIEIDDSGSFEMNLGDNTVTDTGIRDGIVDTWVKVEVVFDLNEDEATFRLYWENPSALTPDLEVTSDLTGFSNTFSGFECTRIDPDGISEDAYTYVGPIEFGDRTVVPSQPNPTGNDFVEWSLGTFLMSTPTRTSDENGVVTREIEAYDRTRILVDEKLSEPMTVEKGKNYTELLNELLSDYPHVIEPSDGVCGRTREFAVGLSLKEVVDRIAESISYHTVQVDEMGRFILDEYISPDDRTPEFDYSDDEVSIMQDDVEVEFDTFEIANVWIVSLSEVEGEPHYVKLENHDPANPFSIPRRGRRIVDFREQEEGFDPASLMRKAKRIQFESNREFENVEFTTLTNPLHAANDCYTVKFSPLDVSNKYTEINWEMPLEAGAEMTHTCRRNVNIDPELFAGFVEDLCTVNGSFSAGNMAWGVERITPVANKPTKVTVTGLDLKGSGKVHVFVTALGNNSSMYGVSTYRRTSKSFEIWVYRTTTSLVDVSWLAVRDV